jgi:hypothetical protein
MRLGSLGVGQGIGLGVELREPRRYKAVSFGVRQPSACARSTRGHRRSSPRPRSLEDVALLRLLLLSLLLVMVGGGTVFLALWDIPAPTRQVEIVLPDERLPR